MSLTIGSGWQIAGGWEMSTVVYLTTIGGTFLTTNNGTYLVLL